MKKKNKLLTKDQVALFTGAIQKIEFFDARIFSLVSALAASDSAQPASHRYARIIEFGEQLARARKDRLEWMADAARFTPDPGDVEGIILTRRAIRMDHSILRKPKFRKKDARKFRRKILLQLMAIKD